MARKPHRAFFIIVLLITTVGFFIFSSASLGILGRDDSNFNLITIKQLSILVLGFIILLLVSRLPFRIWQRASLILFVSSVIATVLVFVPGLGLESGGARRWLLVGSLSIQPAEFLKLGFVLYLAALLAKHKGSSQWQHTLGPLLVLLTIVGAILVLQPDIDTLMIMTAGGVAMTFAAGCKWRHLLIVVLIIAGSLAALIATKPYIRARVQTFFNPTADLQGAGYQINQSLIAIGSGGLFGRGFGQSIQKFEYLPEPIGDSVFAVAAEEFGLIGSLTLVVLFVAYALAGLKIAIRAPSPFARLATVGIVIMIVTGAFSNIAAMLGLIPLTGTPLVFVSHGGTSLLMALIESGIVLNISRHV